MAPLRLRHPKGVSTLQVDFETSTVLDLQQAILAASDIPPSAQDLKAGYPPRTLTAVIPELPLSSLGLAPGEQLLVTQKSGTAAAAPSTSSTYGAAPPVPSRASLSANPQAQTVDPPASQPRPGASAASSPQPDYVETVGGYLIHRIVPDDNSCLFSSIAVVFEQDISKASTIRKIVADAIRNDPDTWSDAILGRPRADYISAILSPNTWGGAIELTILATHYATEIASVDVETGRVDRFTPPAGAGNRVLLIYSGIHYDAALLAPELGVPEEWCASIVPVGSDAADPNLSALKALAGKLRAKRQYTNTTTFDLKCEVCGKGLKGEKEARAHASETGHVKFGEY